MDKEKAIETITGSFSDCEAVLCNQSLLIDIIMGDTEKIDLFKTKIISMRSKCSDYCRQIETATSQKEIDQIIGSVTY